MTCLTLKSDLYKHRSFLRHHLNSISVLSSQINSEDIRTLLKAIYHLIEKTTTRCLVPICTFRSSAGTIRAVPDTVKKVPGLAPVLFHVIIRPKAALFCAHWEIQNLVFMFFLTVFWRFFPVFVMVLVWDEYTFRLRNHHWSVFYDVLLSRKID